MFLKVAVENGSSWWFFSWQFSAGSWRRYRGCDLSWGRLMFMIYRGLRKWCIPREPLSALQGAGI